MLQPLPVARCGGRTARFVNTGTRNENFFKKLGAFLRKTWVWTLLLVLLAALLVWFVGPLLAVADYKFWESPTSWLLSISLMFLV